MKAPKNKRPGSRVLIIVENLPVPSDRRVWQESLALRAEGYDVVVVCPRGDDRDSAPHDSVEGVEIYRYPLRSATGGPLGYAREYSSAVWRMLRLALRLGRFDVVHVCNPPDLLFLVALPLKLRGAKVIFDHHDLVPELYLSRFHRGRDAVYRTLVLLERLTYRLADVVLVTNESYRRIALDRGSKTPDRVFVVRNAPTPGRLKPTDPDDSLKLGKEHLLCYVGIMGPQDGVDYALRALAYLRDVEGRDDWHAAFIGFGDVFDAMVSLSGQLGLEEVVTFTGWLDDDGLARYLSTATVCLSPDPLNPLNDVSTMNKILEYMAFGRPIVTFDLCEARVSAGEAAVYVPPNDEAAFAREVARLLDDPAQRARMGEIGRRRLEQTLSWKHSERELLSGYTTALTL